MDKQFTEIYAQKRQNTRSKRFFNYHNEMNSQNHTFFIRIGISKSTTKVNNSTGQTENNRKINWIVRKEVFYSFFVI